MFPFKFEIKEALIDFLRSTFKNNLNETRTTTAIYVFSAYLNFLDYKNKTEVYEAAENMGKDYYTTKPLDEQLEYLATVPPVIYTNHMYDEEEYKLLEYTGIYFDRSTESRQVHNFLMNWLEKRPTLKKIIHPWLKDYNNFRYWTGIIASRAYRATMMDYERLKGISIVDTNHGAAHKQLFADILNDYQWSCLLPFIDLCNHRNANDPDLKEKVEFILAFNEGGVNVGFSAPFVSHEEYNYAYVPFSPNEKLLFAYGFYIEGNGQSVAHLLVNISKRLFPKEKYNLAMKMKTFEHPFEGFYSSPQEHANIQMQLFPHRINYHLLNVCRLYVYPIQNFNSDFAHKRLIKNQWISYDNEIGSLSLYRFTVFSGISRAKLTYMDILYSLERTRAYFKANRTAIVNNPMKRFKYRLRRRMMHVAKENRRIHHLNMNFIHRNIEEFMSDQLKKLKSHYTSI